MHLHVEINQAIGNQLVNGFKSFEILFQIVAPIRFVVDFEVFSFLAESQTERVEMLRVTTSPDEIRAVDSAVQNRFGHLMVHGAVEFVTVTFWRVEYVRLPKYSFRCWCF